VSCNEEKYTEINSCYLFELIPVETLGVPSFSADSLLKAIGKKIFLNTMEGSFFYQRISVLVQRFSDILLCFVDR